LEFVGFCGWRKTREHEKKNPRSKARTKNKLNPNIAPGPNRAQALLVIDRAPPCLDEEKKKQETKRKQCDSFGDLELLDSEKRFVSSK